MNANGLDENLDYFKLSGKKVRITKGSHEGKHGQIISETGYTDGYGVVCKIILEDGTIGEWTADFFEIAN